MAEDPRLAMLIEIVTALLEDADARQVEAAARAAEAAGEPQLAARFRRLVEARPFS